MRVGAEIIRQAPPIGNDNQITVNLIGVRNIDAGRRGRKAFINGVTVKGMNYFLSEMKPQ
ncbi:hypothetical protein NITGR_130068 [Nitrospina gracilis 3/211]|uniref:Uncharacterized protein n=1 Tax=Nitrospina gracilis (strain 3/211) TaxID=1266370 RepID=M1YVV9_NITG3|nr:hypothetical protein NITGR_130068 [Nitrospina gracilis 3/211]